MQAGQLAPGMGIPVRQGRKAACVLSDMKATVKHTDRHDGRTQACKKYSLLNFFNINYAFNIKDLDGLGVFGFSSLCLCLTIRKAYVEGIQCIFPRTIWKTAE